MTSFTKIFFVLILGIFCPSKGIAFDSLDWAEVPTLYKGRFRPLDTCARLWLYDFYHEQHIKKDDLPLFHANNKSALNFMWNIHCQGYGLWIDAPLFWISSAKLKTDLGLPLKQSRFPFNQLDEKRLANSLLTNNSEASHLKELLVQFIHFKGAYDMSADPYVLYYKKLSEAGYNPKKISLALEENFPLPNRLSQAGSTFIVLPGRFESGIWYSLQALLLQVFNPVTNRLEPIHNFTVYSDEMFNELKSLYFKSLTKKEAAQGSEQLAKKLKEGYSFLASKPYKQAYGNKFLTYPSPLQLKIERYYYEYSWISFCLFFYTLASFCFFLYLTLKRGSLNSLGFVCFLLGFGLHTLILATRSFILQRPPVSNMFETVIYVPWVAALVALLLSYFMKNIFVLLGASLVSVALLILLKAANLSSSLENVQAVLDSQYWLIVHVLMVVGSYGAFLLSGILGHFYLIGYRLKGFETPSLHFIAKFILQSMYLGVALLIGGTILGGVWAAESWGRFWDWDPKESWAFISSCIYLLWIHAYTFNRIGNFGLAIGSVIGLIAITFTWYGVNYILGTGLHSYGFGDGGEHFYYSYIILEGIFLSYASLFPNHSRGKQNEK